MGNLESRRNFLDFQVENLKLDEAFLVINSSLRTNRTLNLLALSSDCVKCAPTQIGSSDSGYFITNVDTKYETTFFLNENSKEICSLTPSIGEFGIYEWRIENETDCVWSVIKEEDNIYWPLLFAILFFVVLGLVSVAADLINRKFFVKTGREAEEVPKKRLKAIDTFRGLSIVLMIFVNMGGGGYVFFGHATWNGLLVADVVFPWFLWIMGVCIPISVRSVLRTTSSRKIAFFKIFKRSVYLFVLGLMLGAGVKLDTLRIFGVLQRFSLTYFFVANVCLVLSFWFEKDFKNQMRDTIRLLPHWLITLTIIIIHTTITFALPIPDCPTGYLGPGGTHLNSSHPNCTGGSAGYIDRLVLGPAHLYQGSTIKDIYDTYWSYDPEGLLGTLTSCVQVFLGVQAGSILLTFPIAKHRIFRWASWAVLNVFDYFYSDQTGSRFNCVYMIYDGISGWSLSFVFATSSFAFALLTIFYYLIDVKKWWSGSPFLYPGMNAILLYCGHLLAWNAFPFVWQIRDQNTHAIQLISHLWTTCAWVLVSVWLYRIKFFLAL